MSGGVRPPEPPQWHAQQIAEFLAAVSAYEDEPAALDGAVERAAEAMEAEVAAVVGNGEVLASVGFRAGHVPVAALVDAAGRGSAAASGSAAAAAGDTPVLPVPGVGDCATVTVPVDGPQARQVLSLVETLEDNDDVQAVYANFDIPEEVLAEVG